MPSSAVTRWVVNRPFLSHVLVPGAISLLLIGLYFSGIPFLQHVVAPEIAAVEHYSQREFGALEMLQNIVLLAILYYAVRCFLATRRSLLLVFISLVIGGTLFQFAEEIDYGAHFLEIIAGIEGGTGQQTWDRNIHNRALADGTQVGSYLKLAASVLILAGFVVLPLVADRLTSTTLRILAPSRWCIATVAMMYLTARLAHWLDDMGLGAIDGVQGNLYLNISEYRELSLYILLLLYVIGLLHRIGNTR